MAIKRSQTLIMRPSTANPHSNPKSPYNLVRIPRNAGILSSLPTGRSNTVKFLDVRVGRLGCSVFPIVALQASAAVFAEISVNPFTAIPTPSGETTEALSAAGPDDIVSRRPCDRSNRHHLFLLGIENRSSDCPGHGDFIDVAR